MCTLVWGSISPIVNGLEARAGLIVLFRVAVGAVVVLAAAFVTGRLAELRPKGSPWLLLSTGLTLAIHWALLFETYKRLNVASSVALVFVGPVVGAAIAPIFLGKKLDPRTLVPVGVAFLGLAAITIPEARGLDPLGVLYGLLAAVTFAALLVQGKILSRTESPLSLIVWQLSIATLPMLLVLGGGTAGVSEAWPILVMLGAVHTGAMGLLFFRAMAALEPHQLGTMFYIEPAAAVLYAWVFLGQVPTPWTGVGFALIVLAGITVVLGQARPVLAPVASPETSVGWVDTDGSHE